MRTVKMRVIGTAAALLWASGAVAAQDASFEVATTLELGRAPHQIFFAEDGATAYVAAAGSDHIAIVEVATLELLAEVPTTGTPLGVVSRGESELIVTRFGSDTVARLARGGEVLRELHVGGGPSLIVGPLPNDTYLVSVEKENRLRVIDGSTLSVVRSFSTGARPFPAAVTTDGRLAFVPSYDDGTVFVIDLWNERVRDVVPVGRRPSGAVVLPGEIEVAVAVRAENRVVFLNTATFDVVGTLEGGIGDEPFTVVASPDGRYAFVNNTASDDVSVIDLRDRRVIERVAVGSKPIAMAVTPASDALWVASEGSHTVSVIELPTAQRPAPKPASKPTEVAFLGMTHGQHRDSTSWSLAHVEQTIRNLAPDVACVEIPPNRWPMARDSFAAKGSIEESRVVRFPEYTDVLFRLSNELGFEIVPCAGWSQEMSDLRRSRLARFEADPAQAATKREYDDAIEAARRARPDRATMDDPRFIHSERYDDVMRAELDIYDRYLNEWIGPGGWTHINRAHYALIEEAVTRAAGQRVLITCGGGHKYWILDQLRRRDDVRLLDVSDFLPGDSMTANADTHTDLHSRCREEVFELHQFFEDWFGGVIPTEGGGGLGRFEDVLADDFEIVSPEGVKSSREDITKSLAGAHGVHRDRGVRIWIENFQSRAIEDGTRLATYEEWQRIGGVTSARLSTVVFTRSPNTPNGVQWRHVHETWLPSRPD